MYYILKLYTKLCVKIHNDSMPRLSSDSVRPQAPAAPRSGPFTSMTVADVHDTGV